MSTPTNDNVLMTPDQWAKKEREHKSTEMQVPTCPVSVVFARFSPLMRAMLKEDGGPTMQEVESRLRGANLADPFASTGRLALSGSPASSQHVASFKAESQATNIRRLPNGQLSTETVKTHINNGDRTIEITRQIKDAEGNVISEEKDAKHDKIDSNSAQQLMQGGSIRRRRRHH
jgi:hypothetical protein